MQGCEVTVHDNVSQTNESIVASFPQVSQANEPSWANCGFISYEEPSGQPVAGGQGFGYCVQIGSDAFIIAEPELPPA